MIPLKAMHQELEKTAYNPKGILESTLRFIYKRPILTLGGAMGVMAAIKAGQILDPLHQMASETRKRQIMNDQTEILTNMLAEQRASNYREPPPAPPQKKIESPLT